MFRAKSSIFTPRKHQKSIAFECFRNFRATARSCNATDQSRACKIRIFFWLLQLFIQLRGSGTGSKNHPTTRFGDWIKKCIQVLKRPLTAPRKGNASTKILTIIRSEHFLITFDQIPMLLCIYFTQIQWFEFSDFTWISTSDFSWLCRELKR